MTDITKYLQDELKLHPSLAPQDVVKLCFQGAYGAEHMLSDMAGAREYFRQEYETTPADNRPLTEYIAPTVCRVNIAAWKRLKLNADWFWNMFVSSAEAPSDDSQDKVFNDYIAQADKLCQIEEFAFSYSRWQEYINAYRLTGVTPVRHSAAYREKEKPAYRIISGQNARLIPIFEAMAGLDKGVIAIDGRSAAGKSTIADNLCGIIGAGIVRMDDFFLPTKLRTDERLAQPGGNVHYERFVEEVLPNLQTGQRFGYRKFDCSQMEYGDALVEVRPHPWLIVEGVYSHHPALGNYMDVRVFMDISPQQQRTRINSRNTPEFAAKYINVWIPMEEAYFNAYNTCEAADVVIKSDK